MTANVALSADPAQPEEPDPASSPAKAATGHLAEVASLVRESFAVVEPYSAQVAQYFYAMAFSLNPAVRELFPANMEVQRSRLLRALMHFVQQIDKPDTLVPFLRQLGRDHRKFGVVAGHYEVIGTALLAAVKRYAGETWTEEVERAWAEAYTIMARAMQEAAATDENPAFWPARVVNYQRLTTDLAVITLRPDHPLPFEPGQYISVETPQRPRMWRYLSPANAPRHDGLIEFHVRSVPRGWVSRGIVGHTGVGDVWKLGAPMGRMQLTPNSGRDVLMIAGGTGLSPMRSLLDELTRGEQAPRTHLFYGARDSADLYDLPYLQALTAQQPWLSVVPVAEHSSSANAAPEVERGSLADVVTRYGAWPEREVFIAGSPAMIRATVSRMLVAGTPLDHVHYDPFTID